ncbi:MAG: class I SAM-dependent methyltransferase [Chloroflexota bacterium]
MGAASDGNEHRDEVQQPGPIIERAFTEDRLAALYDVFHPPRESDDLAFYLPLVMSADSVLDVGCGTGSLLRWAREEGHDGRLCGLDPAPGMLNQARVRSDIEWVLGDLSSVRWDGEFDLVVMTGHAFQELVTDDEIRTAFAVIRAALAGTGRFVFETRNRLVRAWEHWSTQYTAEVVDATGARVQREYRVELPVQGDVVRTTSTFTSPVWERPEVSHGMLRFLDAQTLFAFVAGAGLEIEEQFGDWDRSPLTPASPEIITIARRCLASK